MSNEPNLQRNLHRNLHRSTNIAGVNVDEFTDNSAGSLPLLAQSTTPQPPAKDDDVSKVARKNREAAYIKEKEGKSRDPRKSLYPENILIYMHPEPDYDKYKPKQLSENEVRERRALISEAVVAPYANSRLPMACSHLSHWLQGTGKLRTFSEKDLAWNPPNLNILGGLHAKGRNGESHVSALSKGIIRRSNPRDKNYVPPNTKNVIYYQNSISTEDELKLKIVQNPRSKLIDAFFALGTFTLASEIVYYVTSANATSNSIVIDRWRCQIFDTYDWDITPPDASPDKLERQVFFLAPDNVLEKTNFMERYREYVITTVESSAKAKALSTVLKDMSVVAVDVNFFIELEISGRPPRPHWFDVFSEIVNINKWQVDIDLLDYVREELE